MSNFDARVRLKKDSKENWDTNDIVLLDGEMALSVEDNKIRVKIGDGVSTYSQLPYQFENGGSSSYENSILSSADNWEGSTADEQATFALSLTKAASSFVVGGAIYSIDLGNPKILNGTYSCVIRLKSSYAGTSNTNLLRANVNYLAGSANLGTTLGEAFIKDSDFYRTDGYCTFSFPCEFDGPWTDGKKFNMTLTLLENFEGTLSLDYISLKLAGTSLLSL